MNKIDSIITNIEQNEVFNIDLYIEQIANAYKYLKLEDIDVCLNSIKKRRAKEGGKITLPVLRTKLKLALRQKCKRDNDFIDDYVYLTSIEKFFHKDSKALLGHKAFNMLHDRDVPDDYAIGESVKAEKYAASKIECYEDCFYAPTKMDVFMYEGRRYYNSYRETDLELEDVGSSNVVELVKGHIAHLLKDEEEQKLLLHTLAHYVQNPGVLKRWAIVLQGVQGDGKSFFAFMMSLVMGRANVRSLNGEDLESKFTDWAEGQCVTFIEELRLSGASRYAIVNKIKPYITNKDISVAIKGRSVKAVENTTNYMAFTNYRDAIPVDDEDRRWCVLFSNFQSPRMLNEFLSENPDYYRELYETVENHAGELRNWLLNLEIPESFKRLDRAPMTKAKKIMIEVTKPVELVALEDAIASSTHFEITEEFVNYTRLAHEHGNDEDFPNNRSAKNYMQQLGYIRLSKRVNRILGGETKKCYFYAKNGYVSKDLESYLETEDEKRKPFYPEAHCEVIGKTVKKAA